MESSARKAERLGVKSITGEDSEDRFGPEGSNICNDFLGPEGRAMDDLWISHVVCCASTSTSIPIK